MFAFYQLPTSRCHKTQENTKTELSVIPVSYQPVRDQWQWVVQAYPRRLKFLELKLSAQKLKRTVKEIINGTEFHYTTHINEISMENEICSQKESENKCCIFLLILVGFLTIVFMWLYARIIECFAYLFQIRSTAKQPFDKVKNEWKNMLRTC